MAEKYGTVPKRFTKEWWSWFWMYYKIHTIGVIFVLFLIVLTLTDSITSEKYDITLTYAGRRYYDSSAQAKVEEILSPLCEDLDGNGKNSLQFLSYDVDLESKDLQYLEARKLKIDTSLSDGKTYLFIMDKEMAELYKYENADDIVFAPLDDWVAADISEFNTYEVHGKAYGVDISNLKIFKDAGVDTSGMYLYMRYYPREDQKNEHLKGYNASIDLANKILSVE